MKIAYCIPGLHNPSGMERVVTLKANYLVSVGYEVHIIITDGAGRDYAFALNQRVQVHQLDIDFEEPYKYPFIKRILLYNKKMCQLKGRLDKCLNEIKPDITVSLLRRDINVMHKMTDGSIKIGEIHFNRLHYRHFPAPPWMPRWLHGMIERHWQKLMISKLQKLAAFVVLTHEDAGYWHELKNVHVIPNPTTFFPDVVSTCTSKQAISAGRYVHQKGFDRLIAAWAQVVAVHQDWVLKIYGDGFLRERLSAQIKKLGLTENCFLEHNAPDIDAKLRESSIFVLSSRYEGLPMILLEAMASGLPVVSFACPCGPSDIISDGVDGFLVEDGNIDKLSSSITRLIEDEGLRQRMGQKAREKVAQYSIESVGEQWCNLFESLVNERK